MQRSRGGALVLLDAAGAAAGGGGFVVDIEEADADLVQTRSRSEYRSGDLRGR